MNNIEIERKFLIKKEDLPKNYKKYKHVSVTQGFICLAPCIRVRKVDEKFYLTIKTTPNPKTKKEIVDINNDLIRAEYEIEISKKSYNFLIKKCDGNLIKKIRYYIPYKKHMIELDIFENNLEGLIYAEIEFKNVDIAKKLVVPEWFTKEVTGINSYKNTSLSICKDVKKLLKY